MSTEGSMCELQEALIRLISMKEVNWIRVLAILLVASGILHSMTWGTMRLLESKLDQIQEIADMQNGYVFIEPSPNCSQPK